MPPSSPAAKPKAKRPKPRSRRAICSEYYYRNQEELRRKAKERKALAKARKLEAHRVRQDQGCVCPSANYIHPFCAVCNPELPSFEEAWPLVYPMSPIITPAQPPTEDDPIVSCTDPRAFAPVQTDTMVNRLVRWVERRGPTDRFAQALRDERNLATTEWRAWKWGTDLRSAIEDGRALLAAVKEMGDVGGKGPYEESIVHCEVLVKLMVECAAEDL
ncbi:hypothetical protein PLICRDRAFT_180505 [Plicaturopsis crispa FD-325 SS-3]|uniref:Uncharacterized protein n=1 Tax=Plicaturopsis crispa FD-325 SS-3 TaxID=944288 RepID=A0A0C9SKB1_PLICR|nr:hypothetical protein PLICRDRAFT_180505 [Plicaturopsis crispa FD-325 SS-3]